MWLFKYHCLAFECVDHRPTRPRNAAKIRNPRQLIQVVGWPNKVLEIFTLFFDYYLKDEDEGDNHKDVSHYAKDPDAAESSDAID